MIELTVRFKAGQNPEEFGHLHTDIQRMVQFLGMAFDELGYDLEITDMLRPKAEMPNDSDIHSTGRALDCVPRARPNASRMNWELYQRMSGFMNFVFRRPSAFRSCVYHDAGTGAHYHLQCDAGPGWTDLRGAIPEGPPATGEPPSSTDAHS